MRRARSKCAHDVASGSTLAIRIHKHSNTRAIEIAVSNCISVRNETSAMPSVFQLTRSFRRHRTECKLMECIERLRGRSQTRKNQALQGIFAEERSIIPSSLVMKSIL
jgi:hypothetical protein